MSVGYGRVGTRSALQLLLDRALAATGQEKQALARDLGVTAVWFSRLFNGKTTAGSLGVEGCFKLAAILGEPPQVVLRATEKGPLADLLDEHYGTRRRPVTPPPDPLIRELSAALVGALAEDRALLESIVRLVAERVRQRGTAPRPKQHRTRTG